MSIKKSCYTCKHCEADKICQYANRCIDDSEWEISDVYREAETVPVVTEQAETEECRMMLVIEKKAVMQAITNNANYETFVNDKGMQTLVDAIDAITLYEMHGIIGKEAPKTIMPMKPEHDAVSHPAHYTSGGIECIDCIKAALGQHFIGFLMGNVIKYSYRYKDKNGAEDLKKARWYLDRAIKEVEQNAE